MRRNHDAGQATDIAFDRGQAGNHFVELALHAVEAFVAVERSALAGNREPRNGRPLLTRSIALSSRGGR
jgi:hypothetical protein